MKLKHHFLASLITLWILSVTCSRGFNEKECLVVKYLTWSDEGALAPYRLMEWQSSTNEKDSLEINDSIEVRYNWCEDSVFQDFFPSFDKEVEGTKRIYERLDKNEDIHQFFASHSSLKKWGVSVRSLTCFPKKELVAIRGEVIDYEITEKSRSTTNIGLELLYVHSLKTDSITLVNSAFYKSWMGTLPFKSAHFSSDGNYLYFYKFGKAMRYDVKQGLTSKISDLQDCYPLVPVNTNELFIYESHKKKLHQLDKDFRIVRSIHADFWGDDVECCYKLDSDRLIVAYDYQSCLMWYPTTKVELFDFQSNKSEELFTNGSYVGIQILDAYMKN